MLNSEEPSQETYTEAEAARILGITVARLRALLDRYVFNDGTVRPANLELLETDLLLLRYWIKSFPQGKVVRMPNRK